MELKEGTHVRDVGSGCGQEVVISAVGRDGTTALVRSLEGEDYWVVVTDLAPLPTEEHGA